MNKFFVQFPNTLFRIQIKIKQINKYQVNIKNNCKIL